MQKPKDHHLPILNSQNRWWKISNSWAESELLYQKVWYLVINGSHLKSFVENVKMSLGNTFQASVMQEKEKIVDRGVLFNVCYYDSVNII